MPNLSSLVGSRICHDLINPLGAIGNGLELLEMSGAASGEEMTLVNDSVENATAKLRFLRVAFGDAAADQMIGRSETLGILGAIAMGGRLSYSWNVPQDSTRREVRVAFLAIMCLETALPLGGDIEVQKLDGTWTLRAKHDRLNLDPELWVPMSKGKCPDPLLPVQVQFGLLPDMAAEAGRTLKLAHGADWVQMTF